jgi:hypothetical protein
LDSGKILVISSSYQRSPSIPLKKGEEENLINSPPFTRGAGGIYSLKRRESCLCIVEAKEVEVKA